MSSTTGRAEASRSSDDERSLPEQPGDDVPRLHDVHDSNRKVAPDGLLDSPVERVPAPLGAVHAHDDLLRVWSCLVPCLPQHSSA
jgi:hypothetical protein